MNGQYNNTALALRRRSRWEAVDAGVLLWRDNFPVLLLFYAIPFWLCAFGLRFIPDHYRYLSWFILWFLRPLFERLALHPVSIRFFERNAGIRRLGKGLFKTLMRGIIPDLSWRRFSPLRGALAPMRTLEGPSNGSNTNGRSGLSFRQAALRRSILKTGGLGFCRALTLWSLAMEVVLFAGELLFFLITLDILQPGLFSGLLRTVDNWELYIYTAWCINAMLMGSLYVCMGFSLYINTRIDQEGWDLEIIFRNLTEKAKRKNPAWAALIVLLLVSVTVPQANTSAREAFPHSISDSSTASAQFINDGDNVPLDVLHTILKSPDFGGERDGWGIRLKQNNKNTKLPQLNLNINPLLEKIRQFTAILLRAVLIGLLIFIAVMIFIRLRSLGTGKSLFKKAGRIKTIPHTPGQDPQALLEQSQKYFEQGLLREAWGLCIAALFRSLTLYRGLVFPPDATEYGCLGIAHDAGQGNDTDASVHYWIAFVYGGQLPPDGSYEKAIDCCLNIARPSDLTVPGELA